MSAGELLRDTDARISRLKIQVAQANSRVEDLEDERAMLTARSAASAAVLSTELEELHQARLLRSPRSQKVPQAHDQLQQSSMMLQSPRDSAGVSGILSTAGHSPRASRTHAFQTTYESMSQVAQDKEMARIIGGDKSIEYHPLREAEFTKYLDASIKKNIAVFTNRGGAAR